MDRENGGQIDDRTCASGSVEEEKGADGEFELNLRPIRVQICSTCVEFKLERDFLFGKCENFERQLTELKLENAELKNLLKNKENEIQRLNEMTSRDTTQEYDNVDEMTSRESTHDAESYDDAVNEENEGNFQNSEEMVFENVDPKEDCAPDKMDMVGKENLPWDRWTDFQEMMCSRMNENGEVIVKEEPEDVDDELTENDEEELSEDDDAWDQPYEVETLIHEDSDESVELPKTPRKRRRTKKLEATETENGDRQQVCKWISRNRSGESKTCDEVFASSKAMVTHITRKHVRESKSGFLCFWESCRMKDHAFRVKQNLVKHLRMHTGERPYKCPVEGCGKTFPHSANLYQHKKCHLMTSYRCTVPGCRKVFSRKQSADEHYLLIHARETGLRCTKPGCGRVFVRPAKFRAHLLAHTRAKTYSCRVSGCEGMEFSCRESWLQHKAIHANKYECTVEGCGLSFAAKKDLEKHVRLHTGSSAQSSTAQPEFTKITTNPVVKQPTILYEAW